MLTRNNFLILSAIVLCFPGFALATKAGIIIKKQDGNTKTACVDFDGETISGLQLLQKSPFNPVVKNGFVIQIDGEGEKDSAQMSKDDLFWSYWKFDSYWRFQNVGANYSRVANGDIEGWEFGRGKSSLPKVSFEQICPSAKSEDTKPNETIDQAGDMKLTQIPVTAQRVDNLEIESPKNILNNNPSIPNGTIGGQIADLPQSVKGATDTKQPLSIFPKFNLKNVLILFAIFILAGTSFVFIKAGIKKFVKSR